MFSTSISKQPRKNSLTAGCKCLNHHKKPTGQHKMKQLKTRKERSAGREASKIRSQRHHCCCGSSKEMAHFSNFCCSNYNCSSGGDALFPNAVPAAQEPSIITDSRLIGHHGLFNHEVKSIDIERLLSEKVKHEKSQQQVKRKEHALSHSYSSPHESSPFSSKDLLGADIINIVPFEKKSNPATNIHDDYWEKGKIISQKSDVTPGQRPQQSDLSSGSPKSIFALKQSSCDASVIKSKNTNSVISEMCKDLSPLVDKDNAKTSKKSKTYTSSTLKHTPKNEKPPFQQTTAHGLSPSPLQVSSSPITKVSDRRQDPSCLSESVHAVAARLCDCLQFTRLMKRNLVTETRKILLRALQETHGPQLQENLLKVREHLNLCTGVMKVVQDEKPTVVDEDGLFSTDASTFEADTAIQLGFDTQRYSSLNMSGSANDIWSSRKPHQSFAKRPEWLASAEDASASPLDNIFGSSCSPQFCVEPELLGGSASNHLFSPCDTSHWAEKASASQHWEDSFDKPKSREPFMFESFQNSFMSHRRAIRQSCVPKYSGSNIQPFISYPAQLPDRLSAEPMHISQEPDPFVTDRHSYAPFFSTQVCHPNQSNHLQTFSHFAHSSKCPPFRSHHTDMMHYPPSHMLERDSAPLFTSFPSPEHWSFPPMRLY